jgi:glutathione S-transferase
VAYGLCRARLVTVFGASYNPDEVIAHGHQFLKVMEHELRERQWLAGESPTVADIANYAYVAHAPEGNVSLDAYPNVRAWLERVEGISGFVPMARSVAGLVKA